MSREVRLSDRIKQLSISPSTGTLSLDSTVNGFSRFSDFYEDGDVVFYAATDGIRYEIGSGEYLSDTITRYPFRSNSISSGPYFVNDASSSGPTAGQQGYFYPLYLTKSAASGLRCYTGTLPTSVLEHTFSGYPGTTFYMPNNHQGVAVPSYHAGVSGENYAVSGAPVNFQGITEVFITYPGKYSVFTGGGVSGFKEPRKTGLAFWGNEQTLDYDSDIIWSTGNAALGISQSSPNFSIDIGGLPSYSQIRASGFIDGGSGIFFSGGQSLPQDILKIASGGRQLEPFYRNELDNQTKTNQVFALSGLVNQRFLFKQQLKGQVFAGPASGCIGSCSPDYPEFRYLSLADLPDLSSLYVVQQNYFPANQIPAGAVAFTNASGKIEFDQQFVFNKTNNYLGIGTNNPNSTLDVNGSIYASGDIYASGNIFANQRLATSGNLIVANNAFVSGVAFANSGLTTSGNLTVASNAFVSGVAFANGGLTTSGNLTVASNAFVSGVAFANGGLTTSGNLTVASNAFVSGVAFANGGLSTSGNLTVASNAFVSGVAFANGGLSTSGNVSVSGNIIIAGTGTKIATSTSQPLAFWNASPIQQPTTSVSSATILTGTGNTIKDDDTFDGYTIPQVIKALRNMGLLA